MYYCVYRYRPYRLSHLISAAPRTDTHCRPWSFDHIVAVSANLKDSLYVTKETSIILFQLGAVNIFTFSPLNVNWTFRSDPPPSPPPPPPPCNAPAVVVMKYLFSFPSVHLCSQYHCLEAQLLLNGSHLVHLGCLSLIAMAKYPLSYREMTALCQDG